MKEEGVTLKEKKERTSQAPNGDGRLGKSPVGQGDHSKPVVGKFRF